MESKNESRTPFKNHTSGMNLRTKRAEQRGADLFQENQEKADAQKTDVPKANEPEANEPEAEVLRRMLRIEKQLAQVSNELKAIVPEIEAKSRAVADRTMSALRQKTEEVASEILKMHEAAGKKGAKAVTEAASDLVKEAETTLHETAAIKAPVEEMLKEIKQWSSVVTDLRTQFQEESKAMRGVTVELGKEMKAANKTVWALEGERQALQRVVQEIEQATTAVSKKGLAETLSKERQELVKAAEWLGRNVVKTVESRLNDEVTDLMNKIMEQRQIVEQKNRDEKRAMSQRIGMYGTMKGEIETVLDREERIAQLARTMPVKQAVIVVGAAALGGMMGSIAVMLMVGL